MVEPAKNRMRDNLSDDGLLRSCGTRPGRQLQHGGALALAQARNQHHLSVRKLQRIMMGHGVVRVDLSEARELLSDFLARENANAELRLALYVLVERNLGARQQTDRNMRLPDRREAAGDGIVELGGHQLVLDLGRPGRDIVQTIITH
jgi:hypothetical protein